MTIRRRFASPTPSPHRNIGNHRTVILRYHKSLALLLFAVFLLAVFPVLAKIDIDFDPNLDFSKYKTFAFLGGVRNLTMLPVDPEVLDDQVHRAIAGELVRKGLREVRSNADLVVRYWASPSQQVNPTNMGDWGPYSPYIASYWEPMYDSVSASTGKENALLIDLIDPKTKNLVWRLYVTRKFSNADKDWKKADDEFTKGFENYPPSEKEKDTKRKERAARSR
jgi:hypothetical protein